ncbi:MAG: hypothetical protein RL441_1439 [Actinomycetota bacterium]
MLWWWPVSPRLEPRSVPANSDPLAAAEQMLTRLEAELMVASDFDSALESVQWRTYALRPDIQRGLEQAQAVVGEHGASGVPFVAALARRVHEQIDLRSRWETAAAAAHSASLMLLILPTALWALAEGLGVHAVSWLIGSTGGWMCIAVGLGLTGIARVVLRLLRRSALEPRSSSRVVPISSAAASVSAGIAVLSLRSDAVGIAFCVGVGLAVSHVWSRLEWNAGRVQARDLSWVSIALATSLDAGLDWFSAINVAAECADGDLKLRLVAIAQRLEWGIEPSAAFAGEDFGLAEIGAAISQTHSSGAPISHALFRAAASASAKSHAQSLKRVEKLASFAVVPVTALQLPAFIVLGLVPVVITQLQPLLTAFSSSRVLL